MKSEILNELFIFSEISPILSSIKDEMVSDWGDDIPVTVLSSNYAKAIVESWLDIGDEVLILIFNSVESMLEGNNERLHDAICTGFLEKLMHEVSSDNIEYESIIKYLGVKSKEYCIAYNEFTGNI